MAQDQTRGESRFETLKVTRGREARTIAERESEGWELVDRSSGRLRTELTFRREVERSFFKPWMGIAALATIVVVAISGGVIAERIGGDDGSPDSTSSQPSQDPGPAEPKQTSSDAAGPLTIETSADLRELLTTEEDYGLSRAFADSYVGREIEFDGSVADTGAGRTLVYAGDNSDSEVVPGPAFQFRTDQLPVRPGEPARFVAIVGNFNANQGLFFLELVSARSR